MYQVLTVIRACLQIVKRHPDGDINIMFWCRSGRHRSVVLLQFVRAVLESLQYTVTASSS